MENKTSFTQVGDKCMLIERVYEAPVDVVYQKTIDPALVPHWWGPAAMTTEVEAMDVHPGGMWRFVQHDSEDTEYIFYGEYKEVVPNERLSYTFIYEDAPEQLMTETVTFLGLAGKTLISVADCFDSADQLKEMMKQGMQAGATESMERFAALVEPAVMTRKS